MPVGRALSGVLGHLRRVASWLWDARLTCGTLAGCAAALAAVLWMRSEPSLRWIGLALQLAGVATVAYGIRETRSLFGQPRWRERLRAWWARRPKRKLSSTASGMAGVATATSSASGRLTALVGPDATLEQRVGALEQNLGSLEQWLGDSQGKLSQGLQETSARLEAEARTRTQETGALDRLLRAAQVGGLDVSAMGLVWLALGLLLATGSAEITRWMGWAPPSG